MSLQNTGIVGLEYDWHIVMVDQQTALDIVNGVLTMFTPQPTAAALPTTRQSAPPSKAGTDAASSKTAARSSVASSVRPADSVLPETASPPSATATGNSSTNSTLETPSVIEASSSFAQHVDTTQPAGPAVATMSLVPQTMSHAGTESEDVYVPFSVTPASGDITAGSAAEIIVKFSPLDVSEYFACLYARY